MRGLINHDSTNILLLLFAGTVAEGYGDGFYIA